MQDAQSRAVPITSRDSEHVSSAISEATRTALVLDPSDALPLKQDRNLGLEMIRALAVILVLSTHWGNNMSYWFGLGPEPQTMLFLGTLAFEFFFVMSGFLIGCLLLDIVRVAPTWTNLLIFLVRRWMRTLPLYYLWLVLLLVVFPPAGHVWEYGWRFATITQNFIQPMPEDYFYAVSWSLGIEEWFYLLFSSSMIICAMVMPKRIAVWLPLAVFFIVPPILRLQVPGYSDWSTGLAKVVIFRLDEIAYGVLMAHLYMRRSWVFRYPVPPFCLGISLILFHDHVLPPQYFFPFIFSLMAFSCAMCLPLVLRLQQAPFWFTAIVRRLSAQSYGLYIMHLTILVDLAQGLWWRHIISAWTAVVIAVTLPLILSYISFHFFESPILAWRPRQRLGKRRESPSAGNPLARLNDLGDEAGEVAPAE